ncbi:MAG: NAD-dependent epimerase/dehydratase family protein [Bryobacteraceae bacterium]
MDLSTERFFITGATGFVGAALARRLAALGCEVHALVRPGALKWRLAGVEDRIRFHTGDLTDAAALRGMVNAIEPSVIYHLAVHGAYPHQTDADQVILTNVFGTWNLLKACAEVDYRLFVNTGSSSEYGAKQFAMRETDLPEPSSYYAVAKCAQTLVCAHTARAEQRPICTFRLFSAYGPYEAPTRLIPTLVTRCLRGEELDMVTPDTARDFIYVDDVVDAFLQIGQLSLQRGETFNIGTGTQSTMRDVVRAVMEAAGSRAKVNWGRLPRRPWDSETWVADPSKARQILRWHAATGLGEGIRRTVEWCQENPGAWAAR